MMKVSIVYLCVVAVSLSLGKRCTNIRNGLNKLKRGVDVTKLDWLPFDQSIDSGFRLPIIDFTCDGDNSARSMNFTSQQVSLKRETEDAHENPDQVGNMNQNPAGSLSESVDIFKTSNSYKKTMSIKAGVDVAGGVFSASASYTNIQNSIAKSSNYIEEVQVHVSSFDVQLRPPWTLKVSEDAGKFIKDKLQPQINEQTVKKYMKFIKKFGTHFIQEGKFGGTLRFRFETDKSYYAKHDEDTIKVEAKGMIKSVTLSGSISGSRSEASESFQQSTRKTISFFGGETNLLSEGHGLKTWQPTVKENPMLFTGTLVPIHELMEEGDKRTSMVTAVEIYLAKAHVADIKNRIKLMKFDLFYNQTTLSGLPERLESKILNKIKPLESKLMLNREDVDQLMNEIKSDLREEIRATLERNFSNNVPADFIDQNVEPFYKIIYQKIFESDDI